MAHEPPENVLRRAMFLDDATQISMTTSASTPVQLAPGVYYLVSTVDCRFKQGPSNVDAGLSDTTKGTPIYAKTYFGPVFVGEDADSYITALVAADTGTLEAIKVS
jgi:hypothetical protein